MRKELYNEFDYFGPPSDPQARRDWELRKALSENPPNLEDAREAIRKGANETKVVINEARERGDFETERLIKQLESEEREILLKSFQDAAPPANPPQRPYSSGSPLNQIVHDRGVG